MLEIQEKLTDGGYEELRARVSGAVLHITEALDGGEVTGFIAYSYENDRTVVYDFDDVGELLLCDGLVRSVMFKSCMKGIETMSFELPSEDKYAPLRKLRFLQEGSTVCDDLDGFMNACEHCTS